MSGSSGGDVCGYTLQIGKAKSTCVFRMCLMDLAEISNPKAVGITSILFFHSDKNYVEMSATSKKVTSRLIFKEALKESWDDPAEDWFKKTYKEVLEIWLYGLIVNRLSEFYVKPPIWAVFLT